MIVVTSQLGLKFIRDYELLRLQVYDDGYGVLTVGFGHRVHAADDLHVGNKITPQWAEHLFALDVNDAERPVRVLPAAVNLAQHEFDALTSLCFNIGAANFAQSTLRKMLIGGNRTGAAAQFERWNKARDPDNRLVVVHGLTLRRQAERRMFVDGVYDSSH